MVAGGGLHAGQVIGSTDAKGWDIRDRKVGPSDLAATVFRHLGIDPTAHWEDPQGRPMPIVTELLSSSEKFADTEAAPSVEVMCALSLAVTLKPLCAPDPVVMCAVLLIVALTVVAILFSV